jgi:hypothetical protein
MRGRRAPPMPCPGAGRPRPSAPAPSGRPGSGPRTPRAPPARAAGSRREGSGSPRRPGGSSPPCPRGARGRGRPRPRAGAAGQAPGPPSRGRAAGLPGWPARRRPPGGRRLPTGRGRGAHRGMRGDLESRQRFEHLDLIGPQVVHRSLRHQGEGQVEERREAQRQDPRFGGDMRAKRKTQKSFRKIFFRGGGAGVGTLFGGRRGQRRAAGDPAAVEEAARAALEIGKGGLGRGHRVAPSLRRRTDPEVARAPLRAPACAPPCAPRCAPRGIDGVAGCDSAVADFQ